MDLHLRKITKTKIMAMLIYIDVTVLISIWAIGYFILNIGTIVHLLPVVVIVSVLIRFKKNRYSFLSQAEIEATSRIDYRSADIFRK